MRYFSRFFMFLLVLALPTLASAQKKPIVAIYEINDLARTGQSAAFSTMLETAITGTGKFRVMERKFDKLLTEQGNARAGLVTTNRPGKTGGFEGADFLIYGTITTASATRKQDFGATLGRSLLMGNRGPAVNCSKVTATLAIDIKIVDAASGEVRYGTRINQSAQTTSTCSGDTQIDTSSLLRVAADKVAAGLVTTIYPIQVAAVQRDGTIVLNYGEGAVAPGALMTVFGKGEKIVDPATGAVLTDEGSPLGTIRIVDVQTRFSKAQPVSTFAAPPPIGSIVRPAPESALPSGKEKKR